MKMKNLVIRSLSGAVYVAIFVGCILLGFQAFLILSLVLSILGIMEYIRLEEHRHGENSVSTFTFYSCLIVTACIMLMFGYLNAKFNLNFQYYSLPKSFYLIIGFVSAFLILTLYWVISLIHAVLSKSHNVLSNLSLSLTSLFYIVLPLLLLCSVYIILPTVAASGLILISLIAIWLNDTGAYIVGCSIGKHRLCERLSPKKSWEGFFGGMIFAMASTTAYAVIYDISVWQFCLYGAVISILATLGDLFESLLKRTADVKDSGKLIPGHGGILDRIDSLLFVAYAVFFMALLQ